MMISDVDKSEAGHWIWDIFYYNPDDPSLFVPKLSGLGYTLNLANKFSWLIIALIVIIIVRSVMRYRKKK